MIYILAVIIVVGCVIFFHELGHFTFAKLTGMRVETFSLGFPPRLVGKKIGDTDYCLSAIPLGGYVKVSGVIDESMDTKSIKGEPWEFQSKNTKQKLLFITGGVLFNLILAVIIFSTLTASIGIYEASSEAIVDSVIANMPAESAGIQSGDRIIAINRKTISKWEEMTELIHAHPNDSILVKWERDGVEYEKGMKTVANKVLKGSKIVDIGMIGISPILTHRSAGFFESIHSGLSNTWYWLRITVVSLKMLITGEESIRNLGGPILIAQLAGQSAKSGIGNLFGFIAIISVNIALLNILPIPALDGGHFVVIIIEAIIRKPLSIKAKMRIQQVGLAIILTLTILVFYNDIMRLFK
ncbi:MAG: RIP metalloprotease RseP [Candidatus Neomarinimicrobiota bacterium]|nr:MAG: RIP metalloprotease RseP [Candidatus Neomarinimicrobiota bacterium]